MNPYSEDNSIIIMDNARIHHNPDLILLLEGLDYHVIFSTLFTWLQFYKNVIKLWIKSNHDFMQTCNDSIYALLVACSQITS